MATVSDELDPKPYAWWDDYLPAKRATRSFVGFVEERPERLQTEVEVPLEHTPCQSDPDMWFPEPAGVGRAGSQRAKRAREAVRGCNGCWMLDPCRRYALKHKEHGVWGGLTEQEREARRMRSKR